MTKRHCCRLCAALAIAVGTIAIAGRTDEPVLPQPSAEQAKAIEALQVFPPDNPWNMRVDDLPVHPRSRVYLASIGLEANLHPDFGPVWEGVPFGIPYNVIPPDQPGVPVTFQYPDESDAGPYPIPAKPAIEGGPNSTGDRHILLVDPAGKKLYELFHAFPNADGSWRAGSGAIFDLTSNTLRPETWTSADAAGLPVFPGLVRYDEVASGEIDHALRFTVRKTRKAYLSPARHYASRDTDPSLPPMGLRVRLKADYDISRFPQEAQVVLKALKKHGMLLADNGGNWFLSGAHDPRWDMEVLATLKLVKGRDLEVVDTGPASDE